MLNVLLPLQSAFFFGNDRLSLILPRRNIAKIKLGCVLWMVLSCLRVCEQVFPMGLLWSVWFYLKLLCFCVAPCFSHAPSSLLSSLRKHEKGPKMRENYFSWMCSLLYVMQSNKKTLLHWDIAFSLMPCPLLLRDFLITHLSAHSYTVKADKTLWHVHTTLLDEQLWGKRKGLNKANATP